MNKNIFIVLSLLFLLAPSVHASLNDNGDGTVTIWYYKVDSADGLDSYGITAISSNTDTTYMIWDQVIILVFFSDSLGVSIGKVLLRHYCQKRGVKG